MAGAGYDPQRGFYLDAGGSNWGAFQALFRDFGKVLPGGSCYSVGLGGHTCGGGYGLLSRLFGLTIDWLTGVEVVVKDDAASPARVLYVSSASSGEEADLFWALRGGGGGNFGVITRYYFDELPNAPQEAAIATLAFPWSDLTAETLGELLALYAEVAASPDNLQLFGLFKLMHQAAGEIQLLVQVVANNRDAVRAAHADHIAPLSRRLDEVLPHRPLTRPMAGHPGWMLALPHASADLQWLTFYEAVQTLNGSGPNQRGKYKSAYMRKGFPQDQVEAIFANLQKVPPGLEASDMTQSLLQVDLFTAPLLACAAPLHRLLPHHHLPDLAGQRCDFLSQPTSPRANELFHRDQAKRTRDTRQFRHAQVYGTWCSRQFHRVHAFGSWADPMLPVNIASEPGPLTIFGVHIASEAGRTRCCDEKCLLQACS